MRTLILVVGENLDPEVVRCPVRATAELVIQNVKQASYRANFVLTLYE